MGAIKRLVPDPSFLQSFGSSPLLAAIEESVSSMGENAPAAMAVAVSGGPDSAMLLAHVARVAARRGMAVHALHVHHGLQKVGDAWRDHVHDLAQLLAVPCHSMRISVDIT